MPIGSQVQDGEMVEGAWEDADWCDDRRPSPPTTRQSRQQKSLLQSRLTISREVDYETCTRVRIQDWFVPTIVVHDDYWGLWSQLGSWPEHWCNKIISLFIWSTQRADTHYWDYLDGQLISTWRDMPFAPGPTWQLLWPIMTKNILLEKIGVCPLAASCGCYFYRARRIHASKLATRGCKAEAINFYGYCLTNAIAINVFTPFLLHRVFGKPGCYKKDWWQVTATPLLSCLVGGWVGGSVGGAVGWRSVSANPARRKP